MEAPRPVVRTVEVNAVRLSYRECGNPAGAPVMLLHGSGSDALTWDGFAARLSAAGYRSIALDLRGHARSARTADYALASIRDDVLQVIEALGLDGVTLVGHSVGAYAALGAALRAPERIARLVLEDLAAPPRRAMAAGSVGAVGAVGARGVLRAVVGAAGILMQRRTYDLRAVASILRQLSRPDEGWWARLGDVDMPALVVSGGPTSCIPPQRLVEATAAIPGARLVTIPVGHRVHSLAPDAFAAEVMNFLSEPASTSPRSRSLPGG